MFKKSLLAVALASVLLPSTYSVAEDDVVHQGIDEIFETLVVIGKTPRKVEDVVGAVSVINSELIDKQLVHDIADLLRYEVGINVVSSGSRFGNSSVAIRGISGNRIATEIDGVPVADQFNIGSYSNSGRNYIDPDLIKQVEILRGPASSTYGSDAIGGVISFITKKPTDLLSQTDNDFYLGLKTGYYSVDDSNSVSVNTAFGNESSSLLISGSLRKGHEFDSNTSSDIEKDVQDNEIQAFLVKYFYQISDNQELSFSYDYFKRSAQTDLQSILGLGRFKSTSLLLGDDETKRENFVVSYDFVLDAPWLEGGVIRYYDQNTDTVQLTDEQRAETSRGTGLTNGFHYDRDFFFEQRLQGLRANLYTNIDSSFATQHIGYGIEFSKNKTEELRNGLKTTIATGDSTNNILTEEFPVRDFPISEVEELGVYINDEISIDGTAITIIPAIRYDKYKLTPKPDDIYLADNPSTTVVNISEDSVSPKLGVVYQVNSDNKLYVQYAKGFRAPPFEDANIGLDIPLFKIRAIPNPDLKSETTDGYEIGYNYSGIKHKVDLVGFYNDYQDFIQTKVNLGFDPTVGRVIFQSQNINRAEIYGVELSYQGHFDNLLTDSDSITTYVNMFWSKGENKETNQPLNEIEPNHALLGVQWLYPLPIKMHISECLSYFNSRRCDEIMVVPL
ncbi:TonB-dependent hemoglobin/transferrin/lactoferrin family receptor [Candidatus Colwellia aromaticivorans]|uniref:TonB-dependent hemoglobin/transferrin/lactoferrin family receptor n=1 Tax=Candidatus Colwellia aromaticivorans TaxID=2267621 RepID=UPI000DF35C7A|nr:TonB-dependent hemoglobin/transferrin/lactoferrin family receptor [Candidatus Colwellia aromaticivorans]